MKIKFSAALILILCIFSLVNFAQDKTQSIKTVESFYKFHRQRSDTLNSAEINARKKWFSPRLYNLFRRELKREEQFLKKNPTDKPAFGDGLSFEPWNECVSGEKSYANPYKIGKAIVRKNKAAVEVKFYYPQKCANGGGFITKHTVELIRVKNKWLINDFFFPHPAQGRFSAYPLNGKLTAILQRKTY